MQTDRDRQRDTDRGIPTEVYRDRHRKTGRHKQTDIKRQKTEAHRDTQRQMNRDR